MKGARISIEVTIGNDVDPAQVAEKVFSLLACDPDDEIPEIETVDGYEGVEI